jgi:hypothetical protein
MPPLLLLLLLLLFILLLFILPLLLLLLLVILQAVCRRLPQPVCEGRHSHSKPPRGLPRLLPHARWVAGCGACVWLDSALCMRACVLSSRQCQDGVWGAVPCCCLVGMVPHALSSPRPRRHPTALLSYPPSLPLSLLPLLCVVMCVCPQV